jgi:hypothetical protein
MTPAQLMAARSTAIEIARDMQGKSGVSKPLALARDLTHRLMAAGVPIEPVLVLRPEWRLA